MTAFLGVYLVGCGLLAVAGLIKMVRPDGTALALTQLWAAVPLRRARLGVRVLAGLEAALGLVGIAYPNGVVAALVAVSYLAFVVVVCFARARGGPLSTCGCFGTPDTPPTLTHALIDGVLACAAAAYAAAGTHDVVPRILSHQYFDGVPLVAAAASCGWLAFLAMVRLPQLQAAEVGVMPR